jgi:hypothetical protein
MVLWNLGHFTARLEDDPRGMMEKLAPSANAFHYRNLAFVKELVRCSFIVEYRCGNHLIRMPSNCEVYKPKPGNHLNFEWLKPDVSRGPKSAIITDPKLRNIAGASEVIMTEKQALYEIGQIDKISQGCNAVVDGEVVRRESNEVSLKYAGRIQESTQMASFLKLFSEILNREKRCLT